MRFHRLDDLRLNSRSLLTAGLIIGALAFTPLFIIIQGIDGVISSIAAVAFASLVLVMLIKPRWLVAGLFLVLGVFAHQLLVPGVPLSLRGSDILMGLLIFIWVMKRTIGNPTTTMRSRLDLPIALFLVAMTLATFSGIVRGWSGRAIYFELFKLVPFLLFFPLRDLFAEDNEAFRRLFLIPLFVGILVSASYAVLGSVSGGELRALDFFQPDIQTTTVEGVTRTTARVSASNFVFVSIAGIGLFIGRDRRYPRIFLVMAVVLALAGLVVDFTRSLWIAMFAGASVFGSLILMRYRQRGLNRLVLVPLILVVAIMLLQVVTGVGFFTLVLGRMGVPALPGLLDTSVLDIPGNQHRLAETQALFQRFLDSPLIGQGLGLEITFYSPLRSAVVARTNWHNDYAMLLAKLGIFGVVPFAWIFLSACLEGWYILWHSPDRQRQCLAIALLAFLASVAIASLSVALFTNKSSGPVIVAVYAYLAVRAQQLRASQGAAGAS